jgi:hypothetical protein
MTDVHSDVASLVKADFALMGTVPVSPQMRGPQSPGVVCFFLNTRHIMLASHVLCVVQSL